MNFGLLYMFSWCVVTFLGCYFTYDLLSEIEGPSDLSDGQIVSDVAWDLSKE